MPPWLERQSARRHTHAPCTKRCIYVTPVGLVNDAWHVFAIPRQIHRAVAASRAALHPLVQRVGRPSRSGRPRNVLLDNRIVCLLSVPQAMQAMAAFLEL